MFSAYACQSCRGPVVWSGRRARCPQCRAEFHLERVLAILEDADELLEQGELQRRTVRGESGGIMPASCKPPKWVRAHPNLLCNGVRFCAMGPGSVQWGQVLCNVVKLCAMRSGSGTVQWGQVPKV